MNLSRGASKTRPRRRPTPCAIHPARPRNKLQARRRAAKSRFLFRPFPTPTRFSLSIPMPLPAQIPVKYSEDDAQFISIRPLVRQTFRPAELIDMIVSVTGKDPHRVQQILRSGTIVFNSYRYWWDSIDSASTELATLTRRLSRRRSLPPLQSRKLHGSNPGIRRHSAAPLTAPCSHRSISQTALPHAQPLGCAPRPHPPSHPRLPRILLRPSRGRLRPATRPRRNRPPHRTSCTISHPAALTRSPSQIANSSAPERRLHSPRTKFCAPAHSAKVWRSYLDGTAKIPLNK